jgi:phage terminase small subunit
MSRAFQIMAKLSSSRKLTAKQACFIQEYLVDLNGSQAAIRSGCSPKTARVQAAKWLANPNISACIADAQHARGKRTEVTADRVLRELGYLAFSHVSDYAIDDQNNLVLTAQAHPHALRAVSSIKRKTRTIYRRDGEPIIECELEFRLWDKNTALTNALKHLGLLVEKVEVDGEVRIVRIPSKMADPQRWSDMYRPAVALPGNGSS